MVLLLFSVNCLAPAGGTVGGCGAGPQGWSAIVEDDGILYYGSLDGNVTALNIEARSAEQPFPSEEKSISTDGEWFYPLEQPSSGAGCSFFPTTCAGPPSSDIYSKPVIAYGNIYIGTYNGKVYSFPIDSGEAIKKEYDRQFPKADVETVGAIVGDLVVEDNAVYFGSADGKVYALTAEKLELKWEFETEEKIWTSPAVGGGYVYVGSYDKFLYALSMEDGSLAWKQELPAALTSSPLLYNDTLYYGAFDRVLYAVDASDGREKWKFEGGNWFWTTPLPENDVIYVSTLDNRLYALDTDTGKEKWVDPLVVDSPIVSRPVIVDGEIVVISQDGEMYVADKSTGTLDRVISLPEDVEVMAAIYEQDGIVYVHARDTHVYAVDLEQEAIVWQYPLVEEEETEDEEK
jgi:outer membrane protein assembly factor BamB